MSSARCSGVSSIEKVRAPSITTNRLLGSAAASRAASSSGKNSSASSALSGRQSDQAVM